jgi:gluconolactonase
MGIAAAQPILRRNRGAASCGEYDPKRFNATAWTKSKPGVPDGMEVDREGNIFGAGPGGIHVISPDGKHLGSIETGVPTGNVAWGEDGSSLYITSNTNIFRLWLTTKGAGF